MSNFPSKSDAHFFGPLAWVFLFALLMRIGAALYVDDWCQRRGTQFVFPDSELYWHIAESVAQGGPLYDGKRYVLRSPGYPVFLAGCMKIMQPSPTAVRHMQAAFGAAGCVILFYLVRQIAPPSVALLAAAISAVHPYFTLLSVFLLSESVFIPCMLLQLVFWSRWIQSAETSNSTKWAVATGVAGAIAVLIRPSWILATPAIIACMLIGPQKPASTRRRLRATAVSALAFTLSMSPWWIRNYQVTDHFVATTLWAGASLYDGINPLATGASNMEFMNDPERFGLSEDLDSMTEWEQDRYLKNEAVHYAFEHPWRVFELAVVKCGRYWNLVPNNSELASGWVSAGSIVWTSVSYALCLLGIYLRRRDRWTVLVLLGPVFYFCAIHIIFVSSIRYREVGMVPAIGLMSIALLEWKQRKKAAG